MKTRFLLIPLATLAVACTPSLASAQTPVPAKPAYTVVVEMKVDEQGTIESARVAKTNDTTSDHVLDREALRRAQGLKLPPREKNGHREKYTVRAPFDFEVAGDEGPESNKAPEPKIHSAVRPVYPADLAAAFQPGGVIIEVVIDKTGKLTNLRLLRASNPEFAQSVEAALRQWVFVPAMKNGVPVESRWNLAMTFAVNGISPDWVWRVAPRPSLGEYVTGHLEGPIAPAPAVPVGK